MIDTKLHIIQLMQNYLASKDQSSELYVTCERYVLQSEMMTIDSNLYTEQGLLSMLMEMKDNE